MEGQETTENPKGRFEMEGGEVVLLSSVNGYLTFDQ